MVVAINKMRVQNTAGRHARLPLKGGPVSGEAVRACRALRECVQALVDRTGPVYKEGLDTAIDRQLAVPARYESVGT